MPAAGVIVPIVSTIISAASTAYAVYTQQEAAAEQREQNQKMREQAEETAMLQKEQVSAEEQSRVEEIRRQAIEMQAVQNVIAAESGLQLSPGTSFGEIQQRTQRDFDKALKKTLVAGEQTQSNIDLGLSRTNQQLDFANSQLPSMGGLVASGSMQFASSALSAYGNYQQGQRLDALLARQYSNAPAQGNFYTADDVTMANNPPQTLR